MVSDCVTVIRVYNFNDLIFYSFNTKKNRCFFRERRKEEEGEERRFFPLKIYKTCKICFLDMFPASKCRVQDVLRSNDCTTVSYVDKLDISTKSFREFPRELSVSLVRSLERERQTITA